MNEINIDYISSEIESGNDEPLKKAIEALAEILQPVVDAVAKVIEAVAKAFKVFAKWLGMAFKYRGRLIYLAYYHKKARVRKKNKKRLIATLC